MGMLLSCSIVKSKQRVTRSRRTGIAGSSGGGNTTATARQNRASSLTALQGNVGDLGVVHGRGHADGALTTLGGTRYHTRTLCLADERAAAGIPNRTAVAYLFNQRQAGLDLIGDVRGVRGDHQVVAGIALVGHQGQEAVIGDAQQRPVHGAHNGGSHVVRGGADILLLGAGEDVQASDVGLGVAVLAGLRGGDLDNLS